MPLVAIVRTLGSSGTEIASGVADALAIPEVHSEIPERVSTRRGVDFRSVADFRSALLPRVSVSHCFAETLVGDIREAILELACQAPGAVFRGWGAAQFLRKVPHAICVLISAPINVRIQRIRERFQCGHETAKERIVANDQLRRTLARDHTACDWTDPDQYDAVINTGRISNKDAVAQIVALAHSTGHAESEASRQILHDLRLEAVTRAALLNDRRTRAVRLHVKARKDALYVAGILDDRQQRESVLEVISRVNPRVSIAANLRVPSDYHTRSSSI